MGPSIDNDTISAAHALTEPLLDINETKKDEDANPKIADRLRHDEDGADATIVGHVGSRRDFYVIGQWIWLYVAWSIMRDLSSNGPYDFEASITYILAMIGHGIFLVKLLSQSSGRKLWRLAQVNQETLPAILSGLRVFCLYTSKTADKFLVNMAAVFVVFELCSGFGYSALYRIMVQGRHMMFNEVEAENYERRRQSETKETPCLEAQNGSENNNEVASSSIPKQYQWQRSWCVIGQWIWILLVWSVIVHYLESETSLSYDAVPVVTWIIAMFGHGILLSVLSRSCGKCPSLTRVNRENLPMMLSACYSFCLKDTADQFMVVVATCLILSQAMGAAWRFSLTMTFTTFPNMEKEFHESLKEREADEAAQLEAQIQRMSHLESLRRSDPAKEGLKPLLVVFCLVALRSAIEVTQQVIPLSLPFLDGSHKLTFV
mmetsp:Transcript_24688/g.60661  ORF Transcript_24688/g.60661 Transcript_24688/m.60661 type:complete len:433 (-) Transcript_24688:162-1460(-)